MIRPVATVVNGREASVIVQFAAGWGCPFLVSPQVTV
jgi:hypothetical protein